MDASPFAVILEELVARIPGALAAVVVDAEGECVDYTGRADPFDLRVAGAHLQLVLGDAVRRLAKLGTMRGLLIRARRRSLLVHALPESYVMVVLLTRRAGFAPSRRALDLCERALSAEAGWTLGDRPHWYPVRVECRGKKPIRLAEELARQPTRGSPRMGTAPRMRPVEVLGALVGLDPRERGYRVRLNTGAELTVVREAGGLWYADEPVPTASPRGT
jgi:predicted regulator of Ras-like GTPase activity (Roadblock/LC7/MglB family)